MLFSVCITILGNASAGGSPISQPKFNLSLFISLFFMAAQLKLLDFFMKKVKL